MLKKVIFSISFVIFSINLTIASNTPEIRSITYDDNLSDSTVVEIRGNNLESCNTLKVGNSEIKIKDKSNRLIEYFYKDSNLYSGVVYLECDNGTVNSSFNFPYIINITGYNGKGFDGNITISGENFGDRTNVSIQGGRFTENAKTDRLIIGKIPESITSSEIYVEENSLKSNKVDLGFKIPKITFIYSSDSFNKGSNVKLFGKNLNYYNDFGVYVGNEKIDEAIFKDLFIEFSLPKTLGDFDIKVKSNSILSEGIKINIKGDRPVIKKIEEIEIEVRGNKEKVLEITAENISSEQRNNRLELNGNNLRISEINRDKIIVTNYDLLPGENVFSLNVNDTYSELFLFSTRDINPPNVGGFELGPVSDGNREFRLFLNNFDQEYDDVYLGTRKQNILGCLGNMCRIEIGENTLEGYFTAGRGDIINQNRVYFDLVYENTPYITDIRFGDELRQGTRVIINGGNFEGANIRATNLFRSEGKDLDIQVSNSRIEGRISLDFDPSSRSTINITNKGQRVDFQFTGDEIGEKRVIRGAPLINKIIPDSDDGLIREGTKVMLHGIGFYYGDNVSIGNFKTDLIYENGETPYFIMPRIGNYSQLSLKVTNRDGQESNQKDIMLFRSNDKKEIIFGYKTIDNIDFIIDDTRGLRDSLYSFSISNKIQDLVIRDFVFQVSGFEEYKKLGSFILNVGRDEYGPVVIDSDGKIVFKDIFIEKSSRDIDVFLNKKSPFIFEKEFDIGVSKNGLRVHDLDSKVFDGNVFRNFSQNTIRVSSSNEDTCIDTKDTNINCNSYISKGIIINNNSKDIDENDIVQKEEKIKEETREVKTTQTRKTVSINRLNFRSAGMQNLNSNFDNLAQKLVNKDKNNGKEEDIRKTINSILMGLFHFENSKSGDSRRALAINTLIREITNLKKYL